MRTGKTIFSILFVACIALLISGCEKSGNIPDGLKQDPSGSSTVPGATIPNSFGIVGNSCGFNTTMDLWMGVGNAKAGTKVGTISFEPGKVIIDLTGDIFPFVITAAHIHFAADVNGIPHTKNGNPIPGQFEYNVPVEPGQSIIEVPVEFEEVGAIHLSVVKYGGVEGFNFYLPDHASVQIIQNPAPDGAAYWKFKILEGGFISQYNSGEYEGWCIDVDHYLTPGLQYNAQLFSSYENLPSWLVGPDLIEYPENFDKINYLVNNFWAGKTVQPLNTDCSVSSALPQALTFGDIQNAIWKLIDDNTSGNGTGATSPERVNAILCDVNAHGDGFVPGCTEKIVFIVVPNLGETVTYQLIIGQPIIGEIPVPCETVFGTTWGDGKYGAGFPGAQQWGTYFQFCTKP